MKNKKKAELYNEIVSHPLWDGEKNLRKCSKEELANLLNELNKKEPKVYVVTNYYELHDDKGNEILGVYKDEKDARVRALQEVEAWKEYFSDNEDIEYYECSNLWEFETPEWGCPRAYVQIVEQKIMY